LNIDEHINQFCTDPMWNIFIMANNKNVVTLSEKLAKLGLFDTNCMHDVYFITHCKKQCKYYEIHW